jgi:hypothetical protein
MTGPKNKREGENTAIVDSEDMSLVLEPNHVEMGSGYTVAISYDEDDKPIVDVKTYGQVDLTQLRRDIQRAFPNAEIRKLNQQGSVTVTKVKKRKDRTKKH